MKAEYKSIFIGASIGKTSLINKLLNLNFSPDYEPTTGVNFVNAQNMAIQYWDTPGQQNYSAYCQLFYRNSHIALLCFDPRDAESFNYLINKLELFKLEAESDHTLILVETKADRIDGAPIDKDRIALFKAAHAIQHHVITSASRGIGINDLLQVLSNISTEKLEQSKIRDSKQEPQDKQYFSASFLFNYHTYYAISGFAMLICAVVIASSVSIPLAAVGAGLLGLALFSFFKAPTAERAKDDSIHPENIPLF